MDPSVSSDTEETLNVYHYTYDGPQPYNYEPVMRPREQGETRGRVNGQAWQHDGLGLHECCQHWGAAVH